MIGWLIYERKAAEYNQLYITHYIETGKTLGMDIKLMLIEDMNIGVMNREYCIQYKNKIVSNPDFVICRIRESLVTKQLEYMGIPVFNNYKVASICNDKAITYQYLAQKGIPMVDTWFVQNSRLEECLLQCQEDKIVKAVHGHGGSQVVLYKGNLSEEQRKISIQDILDVMNGEDAVVQQFMPGRGQDLRVYVIGNKVVASVMRTATKGNYKANFSLGGEVNLYHLTKDQQKLVDSIIEEFEFGLVGIDFLIGEDGSFYFNEIEDVVGSRMLYKISDIDIVSLYLQFVHDKVK